jgi:hypothetical protein
MAVRRPRLILALIVAVLALGFGSIAASAALCTAPAAPAEAQLKPTEPRQGGTGVVGLSLSVMCPPLSSVVYVDASVDISGTAPANVVHIHAGDGSVLFTLFENQRSVASNGRIVNQRFMAFGRDDLRAAICSDRAYGEVHSMSGTAPVLKGALHPLGSKC